jgi:hypothetical protein
MLVLIIIIIIIIIINREAKPSSRHQSSPWKKLSHVRVPVFLRAQILCFHSRGRDGMLLLYGTLSRDSTQLAGQV